MTCGPLRVADPRARPLIAGILERIPVLEGEELAVIFRPELTAWRRKLLSGDGRGRPVHAGSDIRKRRMVLDSALRQHPSELARILVHELYHFAWVHLGNPRRLSYEDLVLSQLGAPGELGWSAEATKGALAPADSAQRTRRWREYVCESFCDTAAWLHSTLDVHEEWTLAPRYRRARKRWFEEYIGRVLSI